MRFRFFLFSLLLFSTFTSCAPTVKADIKPRDQWVGLWYISDQSFEAAVQDRMVVELRQDGTFTTGRYQNGVFTSSLATGKWKVEGRYFYDIRQVQLTATYELEDENHIRLLIDTGENLYMVRYDQVDKK